MRQRVHVFPVEDCSVQVSTKHLVTIPSGPERTAGMRINGCDFSAVSSTTRSVVPKMLLQSSKVGQNQTECCCVTAADESSAERASSSALLWQSTDSVGWPTDMPRLSCVHGVSNGSRLVERGYTPTVQPPPGPICLGWGFLSGGTDILDLLRPSAVTNARVAA